MWVCLLPLRPSPCPTLISRNATSQSDSRYRIKHSSRLTPIQKGYRKFNLAELNPTFPSRCSSSSSNGASSAAAGEGEENLPLEEYQQSKSKGLWKKWKENSAEMSSKIAKLGLSAALAYGLFDGVTYTSFFVLAFLGYEKSTGNNPAANLKALLGIVILMWAGNNVTRPFRVAGAAALAPVIDKGLKRIQKYFNFPSLVHAFALVVGIVASSCFTIVGLLILSRWGK